MAEELEQSEASDESPQLVMYCRSWCPDCARARVWLEQHHIPYREVDVDVDHEARSHAERANQGRLHTPTFMVGDGVCVDFRPEKLKDLLGME